MAETNVCTLGYHSHTSWVFEPQILLLYDGLEMNRDVFESAMDRGNRRESTLDYLVAQLLQEYKREGLLLLKDYEEQISPEERSLLAEIVKYWMANRPEQLAQLLAQACQDRIEHLTRKLQYLETSEQQMYKDIFRDIQRLKNMKNRIAALCFDEYAEYITRHYLEQVIFSQKALATPNEPVFEWLSYRRLRELLASQPLLAYPVNAIQSASVHRQSLKEGTQVLVLNTLLEYWVDEHQVVDESQLREFLKHRERLGEIRGMVQEINQSIWEVVEAGMEDSDAREAIYEFEQLLDERVERLHRQWKRVQLEKRAAQRKPLIRIVTSVTSGITAAASLVPIPGVVDKLTEWAIHSSVNRLVDVKYPELRWCYIFQDYQRIYEDSLHKRQRARVNVRRGTRPSAKTYFDYELCEMFAIAQSQLHEYEKQGLLPKVTRNWRGLRIYTDAHVKALRNVLSKRTKY